MPHNLTTCLLSSDACSYGDAPQSPPNVSFLSRSFNCSGKESHLLDCASVSVPFGHDSCRSPYDIVGIKCGKYDYNYYVVNNNFS